MHTLIPGHWYLIYICKGCKTRQILFPDLSEGKAKLNASYVVTCSSCGHKDSYESECLERYHHPKPRKSVSGELSP